VSAIVDDLEKIVSINENNEVRDVKILRLDEIDPNKLETWSEIVFDKLVPTILLENMLSAIEEDNYV
ncbi:MAG: hypothetical protein GYA60_01740, partial [Candidatus Methanofastidiosa archaeon]|nr:hypothetical protein [Candidatus Methanofastidiosa archaeon]